MIKNFISKIQQSDETTKRVWLFILSGVAMIIIVSLWVLYLNVTVAKVEGPAGNTAIAQNNNTAEIDEPGFFATFAAGVGIIFDQLKEKLSIKRNIFIENPGRNFVADEVKPIPSTKLP
jgi:ATP-dependent Zn protease